MFQEDHHSHQSPITCSARCKTTIMSRCDEDGVGLLNGECGHGHFASVVAREVLPAFNTYMGNLYTPPRATRRKGSLAKPA